MISVQPQIGAGAQHFSDLPLSGRGQAHLAAGDGAQEPVLHNQRHGHEQNAGMTGAIADLAGGGGLESHFGVGPDAPFQALGGGTDTVTETVKKFVLNQGVALYIVDVDGDVGGRSKIFNDFKCLFQS